MLKDLIKKAKEQNLEDENIEKELLQYVVDDETTDEDVAQALIEIEKRGVDRITTEFDKNFKIEIKCYTKSFKSIKIEILSRLDEWHHYNLIGSFVYDFDSKKFFVKPHNDKDYNDDNDDTTKENLLEMRRICKLINKVTIKFMIKTRLQELL